jgi:hypothetical protein
MDLGGQARGAAQRTRKHFALMEAHVGRVMMRVVAR